MAVSKAYRPNVDYTVGTQVEVTTSPTNSKTAFIPTIQIGDATGAGFDFAATFGSPDDAAWNGTDPSATMISLLKTIALNGTP